jgi:hypothetical protein
MMVRGSSDVAGNPGRDSRRSSRYALSYLRWNVTNGFVAFQLLAGKTQVAPKWKISFPKKDLKGALVAGSFVQRIQDSLRLEIEETRFFTDSLAVLGMIFRDSRVEDPEWRCNGFGYLGS